VQMFPLIGLERGCSPNCTYCHAHMLPVARRGERTEV
jgi:tRNA A37 methylthiotransferase MiaB